MSPTKPPSEEEPKLGGMALANGLLVHDRDRWAAAVRDRDGALKVASGRSPRIDLGRFGRLPLVRGVVRLAEALAILPVMRRRLPQARLAMEDRRGLIILLLGALIATIARRKVPSVIAREAVGSAVGVIPALVLLRDSRVAVWHGVEHKCIAAYEAGGIDAVDEAGDHAKEHDRCGSNLVMPMLLASTLVNAGVRSVVRKPGPLTRTLAGAAAAGVAVEAFAYATKRPDSPPARAIHGVGRQIQKRFVTSEPSPGDLVVGQAALETLLRPRLRAEKE